MKGEVHLSFLRVYSFFSLLSLPVALVFPPSRLSACFLFTVYSNTAGCSEPLGMKSRLISDGQLSASSAVSTWGIDTFTWHPQFARLDKQGKTNAWSPVHNNRSEWIQVREELAVKKKKSLLVKCSLMLQSITVLFVPSPGRSGEDKAPHGHHHSGGQGLWGGAVCVGI